METNEVLPEYVLQPHAISRAIYRLSASARKLIAMGMSLLPPDLSNLTATFRYNEFCQALGLDRSGKHYSLIQAAILECVKSDITIDTAEKWQTFTWIQTAEIDKKTNCISITFSTGLAAYLLTLKKMYARINLIDFGRIQSLYAIRLFEMAKSYESLAGQRGNAEKLWYFERTIEDLRRIMGIEEGSYLKTNDFRKKVIENPLKELNELNLGIKITPEYIRKGKFLVSIRFYCKKEAIKLQTRKKKIVLELPAPEKDPKCVQELEVKEGERLKKIYAEEYAQLYADLIKTPENGLYREMPHLWAQRVDSMVCEKLKARYGIRK
jgi:plasmid replication initiation protein